VHFPNRRALALAAQLFAGAVFTLSGVGKLIAPDAAALALVRMTSITYELALRLTYSLASLELVVVLGIAWSALRVRLLAALGGLLSLGIAAVALYRIMDGDTSPCGCFGALLPSFRNGPRLGLGLVLTLCFAQMYSSLRADPPDTHVELDAHRTEGGTHA
jgi:hypothetical protein